MKISYIAKEGRSRLILIFAGWSTDETAFVDVASECYDIAVISDYSELELPQIDASYAEVVVIAWSLGVWAASKVLPASGIPVTLALAVNGTLDPVSDTNGIPVEIFRATAASLSERSLQKFRRRMGAPELPRGPRSIEALAGELNFVDASGPSSPEVFRWDRAVISADDAIFPSVNQHRAWQEAGVEISEISGAHTPESWQHLIDAFVIDKRLVRRRFSRGMATYTEEASVQQGITDHLWQLWQKHNHGRTGGRILEIGYGDGAFTSVYAPVMKPSELRLWDIVDLPIEGAETCECDGEIAVGGLAPGALDVIVSANTIQWFNSPLRFIRHAINALAPEGLLVVSTFGPETFIELTEAGVVPLPYISVQSLRDSLPSGVEVLECHDGIRKKVFADPLDVIRHLRSTGVNARPSSASIQEILRRYPRRADGRVSLTYNPVYLILRKEK